MQEAELLIRRMRIEDAEAAGILDKEAFSTPWPQEAFLAVAADPYYTYLVAEYRGKIIANSGIRKILNEGEITNVAVKREYRRLGIAARLLRQLLITGRQEGITAFTLEVRRSNLPAISLYSSLGFKVEGVRPGFYNKPVEDALIMWKR